MTRKRKIIVSIIISTIISLLCYLINNCPYPFWDSLQKYCWIEYFISNYISEEQDNSDAFFINVSYDRDLAEYTYSNGNLKGTIDITNRETLLKFLQIAEKTNSYKYIFLDIRFEKGIDTDCDSALFAQIGRMRDISYSKHSDIETTDEAIQTKAVINDYFTTITNTSFTRYQFIQNGEESIPLRIYKAVNPAYSSFTQTGIFYFCNNKLCQNSPFLRITKSFYEGHNVNGHQNYYDLGPLLLQYYNLEDWQAAMKNKIVIVGDFINDLHDTYSGYQPGSYLVYLAYKSLINGNHLVSWWYVIITFILYFCISYIIISNRKIWDFIPYFNTISNKLVLFIIGLFNYTILLSILSIILYLAFNTIYNILFPSMVFSMLSILIAYKKFSK